MNTEDELKKFTFREPPPFLREAIVAASGQEAVPARRSLFWKMIAAAAALVVLVSIVGGRLDRHWTETLVNSVGPQPIFEYAAEPEAQPDRPVGLAPGWDEEGIALFLTEEFFRDHHSSGKHNGS